MVGQIEPWANQEMGQIKSPYLSNDFNIFKQGGWRPTSSMIADRERTAGWTGKSFRVRHRGERGVSAAMTVVEVGEKATRRFVGAVQASGIENGLFEAPRRVGPSGDARSYPGLHSPLARPDIPRPIVRAES